jgi:hypothetical protein
VIFLAVIPIWLVNATECSTVCGNGTQTITRTCLYGEPGEGECLGADMYTEICHNLPCKVISIIYFFNNRERDYYVLNE